MAEAGISKTNNLLWP